MTSPMPAEISDIIDKQKITEVLYRYCRACDRADEDALRDCFHPDSRHNHGPGEAPTSDWISFALSWLQGREAVTHIVTNPLILVKRDKALSDCHFFAYNRLKKSDGMYEEVFIKGRYIDRFEKRGDEWKIVHRTGIHDFEKMLESPASCAEISTLARSAARPGDPYYSLLDIFLAGK